MMSKPKDDSNSSFSIGQCTHIADSALLLGSGKIGKQCYIGSHVVIGQPTSENIRQHKESAKVAIGDDVVIQPNAIISGGVRIGDHVTIGPNVTIGESSKIGDGTELMYYSQVHDSVCIGENCIVGGFLCDYSKVGNNVQLFGSLLHDFLNGWNDSRGLKEISPIVEDDVIICNGALIIGKVKIKPKTYVAAGAIVTKDTPGHCVVKGVNHTQCVEIYEGKLKSSDFFKDSKGCPLYEDN